MNRIFLLLAVSAWSLFAQDRSFSTSLSAAGPSNSWWTESTDHTVQVVVQSPATCTIRLEGSLDRSNWFDISGTKSCTLSTLFPAIPQNVAYVRVNLLTYSGDAPGAVVKIFYRGSNVTGHIMAQAPYVNIGGSKFVAATMWPYTAMFTGDYLDANTMTITTGTNGSTQLVNSNTSYLTPGVSADSWYSSAAVSSIEGEFKASSANVPLDEGMGPTITGMCLYDSTNSALRCIELITEGSNPYIPAYIRSQSYTYNGSGTPEIGGPAATASNYGGDGPVHFRALKIGGNYFLQFSLDGGQNFITVDSGSCGTISKAIVRVGSLTVATILSLVVH